MRNSVRQLAVCYFTACRLIRSSIHISARRTAFTVIFCFLTSFIMSVAVPSIITARAYAAGAGAAGADAEDAGTVSVQNAGEAGDASAAPVGAWVITSGEAEQTTIMRNRPVVYVESYTTDGIIAVGEGITIHFTVRNASKTDAVNGVLLTLSPSEAYSPSPGTSNQHYYPAIEAGGAAVIDAQITINREITDGTYPLTYSLSYQRDMSETMYSTAGAVSLAVERSSLKLVEVNVPSQNDISRMAYLSIQYTNTGTFELRGARVLIEGNIEEAGKMLDLGVVRPGSGGIAERNIKFTEAGEQQLSFSLEYEGNDGNRIVSDSRDVNVTVSGVTNIADVGGEDGTDGAEAGTAGADEIGGAGAVGQPTSVSGDGSADGQLPAYLSFTNNSFEIYILIAFAAVCVVIIAVVLIRRRRGKL